MKKALKYLGMSLLLGYIAFNMIVKAYRIYNHSDEVVQRARKELSDELLLESRKLPARYPGCPYMVLTSMCVFQDEMVSDFTLDESFFHPQRESFLPECVNGGLLPYGSRDDSLDLDTLMSSVLTKKSVRCNFLYYFLFVKDSVQNKSKDLIEKGKMTQRQRIHSPYSDRYYDVVLPYEDYLSTKKFCRTKPAEAVEEFVRLYIERQNRLLFFVKDNSDGVDMQMSDEDGNLVFQCTYDSAYGHVVAEMRKQEEAVHEWIREDVQSLPLFAGMREICVRSNRGLVFRLRDWDGKDSITYTIYKH